MIALIERFQRSSVHGLLFVLAGLLLGAVVLGIDDRWALKIAGFVLVAIAIVLVLIRGGASGARTAFWTIAFLADREARETIESGTRLTVLGLAIVAALIALSHAELSGDWMAQAGLSIAIGGRR